MMINNYKKVWLIVFLMVICFAGPGVFGNDMLEVYKKAERFWPDNCRKLVFGLAGEPNWIKGRASFWYLCNTRRGKEFILVNAGKKSRRQAFNREKLAEALGRLLKKEIKAYELPFDFFEFTAKGKAIVFHVKEKKITCTLKDYKCKQIKETKIDVSAAVSPDKKWEAFVKNHNLWLRSRETKKEFALTNDGSAESGYGKAWKWAHLMNESDPDQTEPIKEIRIKWSPDSKKLVTQRVDLRTAKKLYLYQSTPKEGYRAQVWSYYRALPGEKEGVMLKYYIFDIQTREKIEVDIEPLHNTIAWDIPRWLKDSGRLSFYYYTRGYKTLTVVEINAATGKTRTILQESDESFVDVGVFTMEFSKDGKEFIWGSERDGRSHLYLYDWNTASLKNRVTKGRFTVRRFLGYDENKGWIYFLASGREPDQDPYFRMLYRVNTDGTGLKLLSPEKAEHKISICPDKKYFVDTYSRIDLPPIILLRRLKDGKTIMQLEKTGIKDLLATGWKYPQAFKVKARDGKTDIYGVMIKPVDFDKTKKYPVIDSSYSMDVLSPKDFSRGAFSSSQAMAQLGFIMVTVDGLGTPYRSREFRRFCYKNLGGTGPPDHIAALKQLVKEHPYLDLSRVGIRGHSAGGYDTAHALLAHPEFYKVGVASAGNHDHHMSKAWWPEHFQGYPVGKEYIEQSNLTLAKNLQGKLLLVAPEMDSNVNPANSHRLAAELIKANKDFDLLILPNAGHGDVAHPYLHRKTWDYFVRHLLGKEPPKNYLIKTLIKNK